MSIPKTEKDRIQRNGWKTSFRMIEETCPVLTECIEAVHTEEPDWRSKLHNDIWKKITGPFRDALVEALRGQLTYQYLYDRARSSRAYQYETWDEYCHWQQSRFPNLPFRFFVEEYNLED